jgi:HEPN domain-containing protein
MTELPLTRARDWLAQAKRDLEQARDCRDAGRHEWACFAAQQAAEKAITAVHVANGLTPTHHSIARLLKEVPGTAPETLIDKACVLDNFYVATRYPSAHPEGAPLEHFGHIQTDEAIGFAEEIVAFAHQAVGAR